MAGPQRKSAAQSALPAGAFGGWCRGEWVCPGYICSGLSLQSSFHFSSDGAIVAPAASAQTGPGLGGPGGEGASASAAVQSDRGARKKGGCALREPLPKPVWPAGVVELLRRNAPKTPRSLGSLWNPRSKGVQVVTGSPGGVSLSWVHLFWTLPPKFFSLQF